MHCLKACLQGPGPGRFKRMAHMLGLVRVRPKYNAHPGFMAGLEQVLRRVDLSHGGAQARSVQLHQDFCLGKSLGRQTVLLGKISMRWKSPLAAEARNWAK
jgi:hypothetical protein